MTKKTLPRPKLAWTSKGNGVHRAEQGPYEAILRKESPQHVGYASIKPRFGWAGSGVGGEAFGTLRENKVFCERVLAELNRGEDPLANVRHRIDEPFVPAQAVAVIGVDQHPADAA